jgi:hypothetical protein
MLAHAVFANLLMHSDDELSEALGSGIVERKTIHEWPLSWVQRVALDDGRTLIYKSQRPPTVEAQFYERAASRLLPGHRVLGTLGDCDIMTIDWIDAPLLSTIARRDTDMVEHGRRVIAEIGEIRSRMNGARQGDGNRKREGDLDRDRGPDRQQPMPLYLDIGSIDAWSANARIALEKLRALVSNRRFTSIDLDAVDRVKAWATTADVFAAVTAGPRLTHGDLKGDQVFVTPDGYRVIDWQRPIIGPPETDLVSLLVEQRMQPRRFIDATIVRIFWFLRLCWAVEAQVDLFPDFDGPLFEGWSSKAVTCILT